MLALGVVGHESRRERAQVLARYTGAQVFNIDDGTLGCDDNHAVVQGCLAELPTTWSVVLEDDAVVPPDLKDQLHMALPMSPSPVVSLYLGRRRPPQWQNRIAAAIAHANAEDASWICGTHLLHAVGYAIKTDLLDSLFNHLTPLPADQHIGHWARTYGHTIAYTWPSLIDHADIPTIVNHPDGQPRRPGRTAWMTGSRQRWTTKAVMLR